MADELPDDPMALLLASAPKEIDSRLAGNSAKKNESPKTNQITAEQSASENKSAADDDNDPDSVDGTNPVIVFDGKSEDEDSQIGLQVRQPSFVSLHGQIIPKGSDSLADFSPIIEEIRPLPSEAIDDEAMDDDDQQVLFVKELKAKNMKRWREMGYEPPSDLIPLVRAASQAMLNRKLLTDQPEPPSSALASASQTNFEIKLNQNEPSHEMLEAVNEDEEVQPAPTPLKYSKPPRPRSGSFGNKLGQATMLEEQMMNNILDVDEHREDANAEEEYDFVEEEDIAEEEEEEVEYRVEDYPLPLRLNQIVTEPVNSPVYLSLYEGIIRKENDNPSVKLKLRHLVTLCSNKFWIDETEYVTRVLNNVEYEPPVSPKIVTKERLNILDQRKQETEEQHAQRMKQIEDEKENLLLQEKKDYQMRSQELDEAFTDEENLSQMAKPSKELLDLRVKAQKALASKRFTEAKRLSKQAQALEEKDTQNAMKNIESKYIDKDSKLKQNAAQKIAVINSKYEYEKSRTNAMYTQQKESLENAKNKLFIQENMTLAKQNTSKKLKDRFINQDLELEMRDQEIENIIQGKGKTLSGTQSPRTSRSTFNTSKLSDRNDDNNLSKTDASLVSSNSEIEVAQFFKTGKLSVRAPKLMNRENDLEIIENMSQQISVGRSKKNVNINEATKKSRTPKTKKN